MTAFIDRSDDVKREIGRVRERFRSHRRQHADSIFASCYQLVFPILRVLGWNPDDPAATRFPPAEKADQVPIVLQHESRGTVLLVASALGPKIELPDLTALDDYLMRLKVADVKVTDIKIVVYTDGDDWVVFRKDDGWAKSEKRLSRSENYEMGHWLNERMSDDLCWCPLDQRPSMDSVPRQVRMRGYSTIKVSNYREVFAAIGRLLVESGTLNESHLPLGVTRSENVIFNSVPQHPDDSDFVREEQLAPKIWMETLISRAQVVDYAIRICCALDADASAIEFCFGTAGGTDAE